MSKARIPALVAMLAMAVLVIAGPAASGAAASGDLPGGGLGKSLGLEGLSYVPGEVLVKFKAAVPAGVREAIEKAAGMVSDTALLLARTFKLEIAGISVEEAVGKLKGSGLVEYASPNYVRSAHYTPNDQIYNPPGERQWDLHSTNDSDIHMEAAWDITKGTSGVIIAVVDSGVAYENYGIYTRAPDLANTHFVAGYDFVNKDAHANDDNSHGTHVAGTIAQSTNNTIGCAGIAFACTVMPIKALDRNGDGTDDQIADGIKFAADHGADVINCSLGGPDPDPILEDAVNYAYGKGAVVCGSTGNSGDPVVCYPAAYPNCIAVGASTSIKTRAPYSNYGTAIDLVAPGGDVDHDYNGDGFPDGITQQTLAHEGNPTGGYAYKNWDGTSMACPHVSGVAGLVKSKHPTWGPDDVRNAIASTCRHLGDPGWNVQYGWGLIDAEAALNAGKGTTPQATSISPTHGKSDSTVSDVVVGGRNFTAQMRVMLERDGEVPIAASNVTVTSSNRLTCDLDLSGEQPGLWTVRVQTSGLASATLPGSFMVDAANDRTWYLAEGTTAYGFEEYVLLQNPGDADAHAQLTFMTPAGAQPPLGVTVPAGSRSTVRVNDHVPGSDVSTKVTSDRDIICERSMYWNNRIEGTDSIGVEAPSHSWYLAEGATAYGFETYLLVQNPQSEPAGVYVTYQTPSGPVEKEPFLMPANSRTTIDVNADVPGQDVSMKVYSDKRIVAERSMYWDGRRGGHVSIGTTTPSIGWFLAEGATRSPYDEWVLLQNPGDEDASVSLTYMTPGGAVPQPALNVPAGSRVTVHVNEALPGQDVSVQAIADKGIVVERAMYYNVGTGKGGHNSIGVPQPRTECFLAEGSTNWGFDEWLLIQNPNDTEVNIGIDYMTSAGPRPRQGFVLAANSRVSVHVNEDVPGLDTSARVYSNLPIIAERAMYWNGGGAGHASQGLMK